MRQPRSLKLLPLLCLALLLASCQYGVGELFWRADPPSARIAEGSGRDVGSVTKALAAAISSRPGESWSFIATSDLHFTEGGGARPAALKAFAGLAAESGAAFALFAGDLVDKGQDSEYRSFVAWADSLKSGSASPQGEGGKLPWFSAVGNHDLYNSGWESFRKRIGPSSWSFGAGGFSFYIIDTGSGALGEKQLESLAAELRSDRQPKVVLSHYPVRGNDNYSYFRLTSPRERALLLALFNETGVRALLCGHWHYPESADCGGFPEQIVGSLVASKRDGKSRAAIIKVSTSGELSITIAELP
jgi:3',5'-cyclic AMP phosphodiesterase CpdA